MYENTNSDSRNSDNNYQSDRGYQQENRGGYNGNSGHSNSDSSYDPIYQNKVRAGKRTYFFDIKEGGRGRYLVLTESKKNQEGYFEKHKIMFFPEDAEKLEEAFAEALKELIVDREESGLQYAPGGNGGSYSSSAAATTKTTTTDNDKEDDQDQTASVVNPTSEADDEAATLKNEFSIEL